MPIFHWNQSWFMTINRYYKYMKHKMTTTSVAYHLVVLKINEDNKLRLYNDYITIICGQYELKVLTIIRSSTKLS